MSAPLRHHRISRLSYDSVHRSHKSHMAVKWHELIEDADTPAYHASLADKSTLVCRAGLIMLSGGTGGYRVREVMNAVAEALGITCVVDVGLITLECTCIDGHPATTPRGRWASPRPLPAAPSSFCSAAARSRCSAPSAAPAWATTCAAR